MSAQLLHFKQIDLTNSPRFICAYGPRGTHNLRATISFLRKKIINYK
jgi:hypothetical protein